MMFCNKLLTILTCVGIGLFNSLLAETTTNPEPPKIKVESVTPVLDLGAVKLESFDWKGLVILQNKLEAQKAAVDALKADGEISDNDLEEMKNITVQVEALTAQIESYVPTKEGVTTWPSLTTEVIINITGTAGENATVEISDVALVSEAKHGPGLGALSAVNGTIPFSVKFLANKNYGKCKITAKLSSNPAIMSSCTQAVKGQSQAAALALEKDRLDKLAANLASAKAAGDILFGILAAIIVALVALVAGAGIAAAIAVAALGLVLAAAFGALTDKFDALEEINKEIGSINDKYIKSRIPIVP